MPMGINTYIKWSMLELRGLLEDEDARVHFQRSKRHLGLHPFQLNDLKRALREILTAKVNFYDHDLQGLVLAYRNPTLGDALGGILHDAPFVHVDIEADFYIFRPEVGCTLKGIANKKAGNHLGVLVHKAFNVSILKADDCEEWLGDYVFVGQEVKFKVTHLDFKGKLPFIRGELIPDATMGRVYSDAMDDEAIEEKPRALLVADGKAPDTEAADSDSCSQDDELTPERMKNEKNKQSEGKSTKTVNRKNSSVDSESSSDDRHSIKKRSSSTKKKVNDRIRENNGVLDPESSSDDRDGMKGHGRSIEELSKIETTGKLATNGACENKNSRESKLKLGRSGETQGEETDSSVELKPKVFRSVESIVNKQKRTESVSKSPEDRVNDGGSAELEDTVTSPLKRSKKNRKADSDDGSVYELDEKPDITVKKRKKKRDEEDEDKKKSPKKSKTHECEEFKVKKEEEVERKSKKKSKTDQSEMEETETEEETKRTKKKSKSRECEGIVVKEEGEEKKRSAKKSKVRESESEEAGDTDAEEKRRSKKKFKAKEAENEAKKIKNEDEEEKRRSKKKSKADEGVNEGKKVKNEDEEERRRSKKKSNADEGVNEGKKVKNEDEEETRRSKKKSSLKEKGEEIVKRDDEEVRTEESRKESSTVHKYKAKAEAAADEFDFIKPDLDKFDIPVAKSKRKRRKTLTNEEATSDVPTENVPDGPDFFQDVRVKVEPDASDVEDSRPSKKDRKRRRTHSTSEEVGDAKKGEKRYENVRIKLEPNMSDVEDSKPSKKKSRRKSISENSCEIGKVKIEPDASDVESTSKAGRSIKCEPQDASKSCHGSTTIPA